jgi:hypothetical protein
MKDTIQAQNTPQIKPQGQIDLSQSTWEELLKLREKLSFALENAEAGLKEISAIMLEMLQKEKINGKIVGDWSISKATRLSFTTPIEKAQELGAVKTSIDQAKLKALFQKGIVPVEDMKKTEYVLVREVVKNTE